MKAIFQYTERDGRHYPLADITLFHKDKMITVKALVDSGASFSVFRKEIAEYLGLDISRGRTIYLEGLGGRILGYLRRLNVRAGKKRFRLRAIFSNEYTISLNILGRNNFFEQFMVTFDEKSKTLILK